jgi:hypothetical protein
MRTLSKQDEQIIGSNINTNMDTILQVLQQIKITQSMSKETKDTATYTILLGCIAMALTIQADILFATAERSLIEKASVIPN